MTVISFKMPYQPMQNMQLFAGNLSMNTASMPVSIFSQQNSFMPLNINLGIQQQTFYFSNLFSGLFSQPRFNTNPSVQASSQTKPQSKPVQSVKVSEIIAKADKSEIIDKNNPKASDNCKSLIRYFEGFVQSAKLDTTKYAVGYGHNDVNLKPGDTCTVEQAEALLDKDLDSISKNIAKQVKVPLTQNQLDALSDFVYNAGNGAFNKSTLLKKLNAGDYVGAAEEFDKWVYYRNHNGEMVTSSRKAMRRNAEKQLFLKDVKVA